MVTHAISPSDCPDEFHGYHYVEWVRMVFGECMYTPREQVSFYLGLLSTLCWMFAQVPQIRTNYHNKSVAAMSKWFLLEWLLGDLCNMLGSLLSGQLVTQIIQSCYFVSMDILLGGQYVYYQVLRPKWYERKELKGHHISTEQVYPPRIQSHITATLFLLFTFIMPLMNISMSDITPLMRTLLGDKLVIHMTSKEVGILLGWVSAVFYICSRPPQIYKNVCLNSSYMPFTHLYM